MAVVVEPLDFGYDESERVIRWRMYAFKEMGFSEPDAEELAFSDANVRWTEKLIDRGCPHALAARIAK